MKPLLTALTLLILGVVPVHAEDTYEGCTLGSDMVTARGAKADRILTDGEILHTHHEEINGAQRYYMYVRGADETGSLKMWMCEQTLRVEPSETRIWNICRACKFKQGHVEE